MDPVPDDLSARVGALLAERGTNGLSLCAFDRSGIRFAGGIGTADLRRGEPVRAATVFRVASISK
ncbi:MAG: beta-lactamase family protein, partial [Chloroflexota bacterium]|nr:beta-lactamase family protein [Chloroflexota bacterium]